jgi:hypothetical protein
MLTIVRPKEGDKETGRFIAIGWGFAFFKNWFAYLAACAFLAF